jgi:hypothetical protein
MGTRHKWFLNRTPKMAIGCRRGPVMIVYGSLDPINKKS